MFTHCVNVNKNFSQNRSVFSITCSEDKGEYNSKKLDLFALHVHKVLRKKYILLDLEKPSGSINNTMMIVNKSVAISYHMMSNICGMFVYMYMCVFAFTH